ncbi:hypothetical protein [Dickeya solani]|uniref:Uncharacterized protein n=1 Tax=Dickeya solani TaxID=1089444 RepID=A0ABU4EBK7_9GAMM|nr:hypothetical protein [Dickeya solani]MCA6998031.1 hypothetical protein [Dickeya solani]MCZ0822810.1 hypothetical protein [Dickeya solani]MDV6993690.1 hypothetical protein [Dickeya solani]MDV7003232.1 hypothetical protein [Dickeya solani]MDV7038098.1 hypothetical protein [Dickeya solani]
MLNPTLTFRPLAQPAAFPLTGASPAPESSFFARSNVFALSSGNFSHSNDDFSHSNGNVTAQPDKTARHQPSRADVIPLFHIKTHAYGSRRPGLAPIWAASSESRSGQRFITLNNALLIPA